MWGVAHGHSSELKKKKKNKTFSVTLPQSNPFLEKTANLVMFGCFHIPLLPSPFLAFHSTFSVFRSCLALCPNLKIKTIKNLCLLNILLFKKRHGISSPPSLFYSTEVKEYFPFSSFKLSDLKPAQRHYFVRLVADLLAWVQPSRLPPHLQVCGVNTRLRVPPPATTAHSTPQCNPNK